MAQLFQDKLKTHTHTQAIKNAEMMDIDGQKIGQYLQDNNCIYLHTFYIPMKNDLRYYQYSLIYRVVVSLQDKDNPVCYPRHPGIFFAHFNFLQYFLKPPTTEKFFLIFKETLGNPEVRLETAWHQHLQPPDYAALLQSFHPSQVPRVPAPLHHEASYFIGMHSQCSSA